MEEWEGPTMQMLITTPTVSRITTPTHIKLALSTCCVKKSGAALAAPAAPPPTALCLLPYLYFSHIM